MEIQYTQDQLMEHFRECIPVFQILADPYRQEIILLLGNKGRKNVTQITDVLPLSRPAISHHLKILRQAGLIGQEKKGTENYYFLTLKQTVDGLKILIDQLEKYCPLESHQGGKQNVISRSARWTT